MAYIPPPNQSRTLTGLSAGNGDPFSMIRMSQAQAGNVAMNMPTANFNAKLMEMMKRHQGLGTKPFMEQGLNAQQEQVKRLSFSDPNMIGASPQQQAAARDATVQAVQPTVQGANQGMQTFGEQINSFGGALDTTRQMIADIETIQARKRDELRQSILDSAELGGSAGLEALRKANPQAFKQAGLDPDTLIAAVKQKEDAARKQQEFENYISQLNAIPSGSGFTEVSPGATLYDPVTGQPVFTAPTADQQNKTSQGASKIDQEALTDAQALLTRYIESGGSAAVGGKRLFGRVLAALPGTKTRDFEIAFNSLKAKLDLGKVGLLKGQGAVSDAERGLLSAASLLDLKQSPEEFKKSLEAIITGLRDSTSGGGAGATTKTINGVQYQKVNGGWQKVSFNQVGNTSASKIAAAIKQVESGGRYDAKGGSGEYGAYQFMPSTWKSWAKTYLGNANAPMTPANQDKVALARIQALLNEGRNAQQIALIWNGGSPTIKAGVNKWGQKYDTGAYAKKVLAALNNLG